MTLSIKHKYLPSIDIFDSFYAYAILQVTDYKTLNKSSKEYANLSNEKYAMLFILKPNQNDVKNTRFL